MTDTLAERDEILDQMVALRTRYAELRSLQSDRLDAITLSAVPDAVAIGVERIVMVEEIAILDEFVNLAERFPRQSGPAMQTVSSIQPRAGWFGLRKGHEVLVEVEAPELPEVRLQDARILHLLKAVSDDLSERRAALQHASYTLKRVVVGLNQSAAISIDDDAAREIERDRHGLETLVSLVDRTVQDLVVTYRRVGDLLDAREPKEETAHDPQLMLAG